MALFHFHATQIKRSAGQSAIASAAYRAGENAAFGAGVCAERVALGAALSSGEREFLAICVCGQNKNITPCGICRQSLSEFNDIEVICCDEYGNTQEYSLSNILPLSFTPKHLKD